MIFADLQNSWIFPGARTQGSSESLLSGRDSSYEVLSLQTRDGTKIGAIFGGALDPSGEPHPEASQQPTLLFFYGNGACAAYCTDFFEDFRRQGLNVLIPDFVGYGMSEGKPSERGCYATADAAYEHLIHRTDVNRHRIIASGWSLGAAVAIDLASRRPVAGLMTFSAFTSMIDMARKFAPQVPVSLLEHRFDSISKIGQIHRPMLMVHGERDGLIPAKMSDELAKAARGQARRINLPGARHNDIYEVGGEKLMAQIGSFARNCPPSA